MTAPTAAARHAKGQRPGAASPRPIGMDIDMDIDIDIDIDADADGCGSRLAEMAPGAPLGRAGFMHGF